MRDIVVLIFTLICIGAAYYKPWYGVLVLAIFSYLNPHAFAWGPVRSLPLYQILFLVVVASTLMTKDRQSLPKDWRIPMFFLLWFYFLITTTQAYYPALAWERLLVVSKIFIPLIFCLILINTREKLLYLIITIACSIGVVAVKGGIFAVLSGFSHRVYGPPATQFYENNAFAIAVLIAMPMLLLWSRETTSKRIRLGIMGAIPLMFAAALSSWSRGALLTMAVLTLMLIWHSKRKYLAIPLLMAGVYFSIDFLPEEWFNRMNTLQTYEADESAMSRIEAWTDGWNHTLQHPFVGAGFEGWRYVTMRDWHNAYVEIFSEHGFIAFGMWLSLIIGTLANLTFLPRKVRGVEGMEWVGNYCYMLRLSLVAYCVGVLFLGLSYWDILYQLVFIAVLVKQFALRELEEKRISNKSSSPIQNTMLNARGGRQPASRINNAR
ncbi:MAG: putative O-glycosylation ligase, exosortase A system-associated [Candidatus Reddybacter sp.]